MKSKESDLVKMANWFNTNNQKRKTKNGI